jgi:hypothetical protein
MKADQDGVQRKEADQSLTSDWQLTEAQVCVLFKVRVGIQTFATKV